MNQQNSSDRSLSKLLAELRRHHDWSANSKTAEALAGFGEEAVPRLILALRDEDGYVRNGAALALGRIGSRAAAWPLLDLLAFRDDRDYEDGEDGEARCSAATALGKIGDTSLAKPLLAEFQKTTEHDPALAYDILLTLEKIGVAVPLPVLLRALESHDVDLPKGVRAVLGKMGPAIVPALMEFVADKSRSGRSYAIGALAMIGDRRCIPLLMEVLKDHSNHELLRGCAAEALGQCGSSPEAFTLLRQTLDNVNEGSIVRAQAMRGLVLLHAPGTFETLLCFTDDQSLKNVVVMAMGVLGDRRACGLLVERLKENDESLRFHVAEALGRIGCQDAIPALQSLLNETDGDVFLGPHLIATLNKAIEDIRRRVDS